MERYCKLCSVLANKTVTLRSWREIITHTWTKHGPFISLARSLLRQRITCRKKAYERLPDIVHPIDYKHWEQWVYGSNLDPHKYDL